MAKKNKTQNARIRESYEYMKKLGGGISELIGYNEFNMSFGSAVAKLPTRQARQAYVKGITNSYEGYTTAVRSIGSAGRAVKAPVSRGMFNLYIKQGKDVKHVIEQENYVLSDSQIQMIRNFAKDQLATNKPKSTDYTDKVLAKLSGSKMQFSEEAQALIEKGFDRYVSKEAGKDYRKYSPDYKAREKENRALRAELRKKYNVQPKEKEKNFLNRFSETDKIAYISAVLSAEDKVNRAYEKELSKSIGTIAANQRYEGLNDAQKLYLYIINATDNDLKHMSVSQFGQIMDLIEDELGITNSEFRSLYSPKEQQA